MVAYVKGRGVVGVVDCSGLFSSNHTIDRWHRKTGMQTRDLAKSLAPKRTGRLANMISMSGPRGVGLRSDVYITSRAYYSSWVHGGTNPARTWTARTPGKRMGPMDGLSIMEFNVRRERIPGSASGGAWRPAPSTAFTFSRYAWRVHGQAAQPFMAEAVAAMSARRRWRPGRAQVFG